MAICLECGKECNKLYLHTIHAHHLNKNAYLKKFNLVPKHTCPICGTEFEDTLKRYSKICCNQSCSALYRQSKYNHNADVEKFEKENDCTNIVKLREIYGQGWYKAKIIPEYIEAGIQTQMFFVKNDYIPLIEAYTKEHLNSGKSKIEKYIAKFIKDLGIAIKENDKKTIYPKELDIYIPSLNIAIEYNGTWFHSIEYGYTEDQHLKKSLMCREKRIRLIHIYEFEDLAQQIKLLKNLIVDGIDNYNQNDFNKNNLIDNIPEPELIYCNSRGYHIYGAGKLY